MPSTQQRSNASLRLPNIFPLLHVLRHLFLPRRRHTPVASHIRRRQGTDNSPTPFSCE